MDTKTKEQIKLDAMVADEPTIAGRKLRPFSAGSLQLCRKVGLKLVASNTEGMDQSEIENELIAFYFIHSFPLDEVLAACGKPRDQFFAEHVQPLLFEFPALELPQIMAFIESEFSACRLANVEAKPRASQQTDTEIAPPNI